MTHNKKCYIALRGGLDEEVILKTEIMLKVMGRDFILDRVLDSQNLSNEVKDIARCGLIYWESEILHNSDKN